jgi:hypothetical protein
VTDGVGTIAQEIGQPQVLGPLVAMALVGLTVLGYDLRRNRPGRWQWRWLTAWLIPAATTAVILAILVTKGPGAADQAASVLALFVAVMGNFGQWAVILRAGGQQRSGSAAADRSESQRAAQPVLDAGDVHGGP